MNAGQPVRKVLTSPLLKAIWQEYPMFISPLQYDFLQHIREQHEIIRQEVKKAYRENIYVKKIMDAGMGIDPHLKNWVFENGLRDNEIGYNVREGDHSALVIFKENEDIKEMDSYAVFPVISSLLENVQSLVFSCISVLGPGATLKEHIHTRRHYVYHLLLEDLIDGYCEIRCNNETRKMKKAGDETMFDYSFRHGVTNYAKSSRINLMIDFRPER